MKTATVMRASPARPPPRRVEHRCHDCGRLMFETDRPLAQPIWERCRRCKSMNQFGVTTKS